jgi:hypothetical protein
MFRNTDPDRSAAQQMKRISKSGPFAIFLAVAGIPALVYVAALLFDPGRSLVLWERNPFDIARALPLALGLGFYAVASLYILRRLPAAPSRRQIILLLAWAFASGCVLQVAAAYQIEPYPLRGILIRQLSSLSGGYWSVGTRISDVHQFLSTYPQTMASFPVHPQRHPPGLPLMYWLLTQFAAALPGLSAAIGPWARPLSCFDAQATWLNDAQLTAGVFGSAVESAAAFLAVVPLFAFVRRLAGARAAGAAALLYILAPGALAWASQFDRSFATLSIAGLWLCERLISERRHAPVTALALGLLLSLGTFLSFGNLPIVLLCAVYAAVRVWQCERLSNWRSRLAQAAVVLAGLLSIWLIVWLAFGFDPVATYRTGMALHYELERPYWPFVVWHAWDILTFAGLPCAGIALFLAWRRAPALSAALAGTLATLCLLHVARGETGRVWMYFVPLIVALAAIYLDQHGPARRYTVVALVVLQAVVQIGVLRMITYGSDPLTVGDAALPATLIPTEIRYGRQGEMQLLGFTLGRPEQSTDQVKPGGSTAVTLYWRLNSSQPISSSYKIFIHVSDSLDDSNRIAQVDEAPMGWALPTSCWRPGQVVRDEHDFSVAADAGPGDYMLLLGLYDYTNQREFVERAQRARDNAVELPAILSVVTP